MFSVFTISMGSPSSSPVAEIFCPKMKLSNVWLSSPGTAAQTTKKLFSAELQVTSGSDFLRSFLEISMQLFFMALSNKVYTYNHRVLREIISHSVCTGNNQPQ